MNPSASLLSQGGVCIVTGEPSGDVQASLLLAELKKQLPNEPHFWGIGGQYLKKNGFECVSDIEELSVMGASEVLQQYLQISKTYKNILFEIQKRQPKVIILVDYPVCNLKLAERVTELGFKVIYYIPPKVWSHGISRVQKLKKYTNLLISILPFEEAFFHSYSIPTKFVGNPLYDEVNRYLSSHTDTVLKTKNKQIIGILPGSRKPEILRLLPLMLESFIELNKKNSNTVAYVAVAKNLSKSYVENIFINTCKQLNISPATVSEKVYFIENNTYEVIQNADYAWVCSGTATLEVGLFKTPMSAIYKVSSLTAFIARIIIKVPYVSLVNLCLNKAIIPEFLQTDATVNNLVNHASQILNDVSERKKMITGFEELRKLFHPHAAERAAQEVVNFLEHN